MSGQFLGYVRPDGRIGIRNYVLVRRAKNDTVAQKLLKAVEDIRTTNPIPENITGGLSTLEEKSLGAIVKSGTSQIEDVIQYAEQMPRVPASGA